MRAAILSAPGVVDVQEVPDPQPTPGWTVVRVRACGICGSDLHSYRGHFGPVAGICPGHEVAGEVAAVGHDVAGWAAGDRVCLEPLIVCRECRYCRSGDYQLCERRQFLGLGPAGGLAEYVAAPAYALHRLPDGLDFELGALVEPVAVTVHGLRLVRLEAGERVLVLGAGSIGLMAAAAARALGAGGVQIIARHAHQADAARALGAEVLDGPPPAAPDVVVESAGGDGTALSRAIEWVRPGGRVAVLGIFDTLSPMNASLLVLKEVTVTGGITYGHARHRSDFELALDVVRRNAEALRQLVTHRFPLAAVADAFATANDKSTGAIKVSVQP